MLLLESQLAACWTYHTAAYFHGAPDTQRAVRLPLFASQDTSVLMWPGNARHPLTRPLPHFPQAQWSWVSGLFPFLFRIQAHEAATVATGVDDIRILRGGGTSRDHPVHQQPKPRPYLFLPRPASKPGASKDKLHGVPKV